MNWIKENKFLSGYVAVLVIGAGVLGYLLYSVMGRFSEVSANYDQQSAELSRLQHLRPYPNAENLDKLGEEKKEHQTKVDDLQKSLAGMKLPSKPITREQFQDKLRAAVSDYTQAAKQAGMALPEKSFYLGFLRYQNEPPHQEAAEILSTELDAMLIVLNDLPKSSVVQLKDLTREELPEEKAAASASAPTRPPGPGTGPAGRGQKPAAETRSFTIDFIGAKTAVQIVLNDMITNQSQFFIPRSISIKDSEDKGPPKELNNPGAAASTPAAPTPAAPPQPGAAPEPGLPGAPTAGPNPTIVGDGLVEANIVIEIVDFPDPAGKPAAPAH